MESWKKSLYLIWIAETISLIGFSFCLTFLPYFVQEFGISDMREAALWTGILQTAGPLMLVISAPLWGVLSDRIGRKIMVERAMFSGFVVLVLMGIAKTLPQLFLLRLLQGIFTGTFTAAIVLVTTLIPREKSAYALGLMQTSIYVAATVGPFLGGIASDIWGYRNSFIFSGILVGAGGCLISFFVNEPDKPQPLQAGNVSINPASFFREPRIFFFLIVLFLFQAAASILAPAIPIFIQKLVASSRYLATTAGAIIAISGAASVVPAILVGKTGNSSRQKDILAGLIAAAGIFTILCAFAKNPAQLLVIRIAFGLAAGGVIPLINAGIHLATKKSEIGKNFGVAGSISALGAGFGPAFGGALISTFSLAFTFLTSGMLLLLTGALCLFIEKNGTLFTADEDKFQVEAIGMRDEA
jgi:DHA1 family multidrug resistance protein-like MFS transporter